MALVFDIETLECLHVKPLPPITCVCMYDVQLKKEYKFRMWKISEKEYVKNRNQILDLLDNANIIIGYNSVLFDLEFIKCTFAEQVTSDRMTSWVVKTVDMFMCLKYIFKSTCKLNDLLLLNGLESKTGTGSDAIQLAKNDEWDKLINYCMSDTLLTWNLFSRDMKPTIYISKTFQVSWDINDLDKNGKFLKILPRADHVRSPKKVEWKTWSGVLPED